MSDDDFRVAGLKFDNAQFEAAVRKTLATLLELNKGLKLEGGAKGLNDVSNAASKFSMGNMAKSIDDISHKFSAMSVVAITALATITSKVLSSAAAFTKGFTTSPITDGLKEYETQLNSIQTILANTGLEGKAGLDKVNAALNELNTYSDKTIYNFTEMARNIGTFTAAGIDLKTSTAAIKGIANLAALSGSNAEQASTAMYQLSQALAAGKVSLVDWNSVVNAGMGGKVFQEALKATARTQGIAIDDIIKKNGSFRDSLQEGWLTSKVLTETLSKFTGDLSAAQLKTMGYTDDQIKGILKMGKTAQDAATKVKTFSQLISTLQEAAGSGWAQTWGIIFGNFDEAKTLFTGASNVLGGFITASAKARNKVLADWKAMGGRTAAIDAIKNTFKALISVVKPIKDAFREIFPAKTGRDLYNLTVIIRDFTKGLILGAGTADKLKRTFAGVFAIFDIGFQIVKQLLGVFFNLFRTASDGSGSFLEITANIGDFLVKLDDAVKNGTAFKNFFNGLQKVLQKPIIFIKQLAHAIGDLFSSVGGGAQDGLEKMQQRLSPLGALGDGIAKAWSVAGRVLKKIFTTLEPLVGKVADEFDKFSGALGHALSTNDFSGFLDAINTGLFGALVVIIRKFLKGGIGDIGSGIFEKITGPFEQLTGVLKAMQTQIKANTLLKIAGAIALLTASVIALSMIDSGKLTKALTAMTVMFTQLAAGLAIFSKVSGTTNPVKLFAIGAALIELAFAIDLLTAAVVVLSQLSWQDLAKGLAGVTVLLVALAGSSNLISGSASGMIRSGAGLILLAAGIKILVSAVTDLSGLSWADMAKGLTGVAVLLTALGLYTQFANVSGGGLLSGAGIVLLATGIKILASALKDIADMSWAELAKGLTGMAAGLVAIGLALAFLPPSSVLSAAAIFVAASSLLILNQALQSMAGMSWEEIGKGLVVLASSLAIIAGALALMTGALPGAAALLVVSAALVVFTPVLITLGSLSWQTIVTGLVTLAAALTLLGIAGVLLTPVVPTLIGLGAGIALLGVGLAAAGAGVFLFAGALTALAAAGAAGAAALVSFVFTILGAVPKMITLVGNIIVAFADVIKKTAPAVASAAVAVITSILNAIVKVSPAIINAIGTLMVNFLNGLLKYVPKLVSTGANLIIAVLNGIAQKMPGMITAATNVIVAFLNGLSANMPRIVTAGVTLIISFINGVANAIRSQGPALRAAGANLASAIISGMTAGLSGGVGQIAAAARRVASSALSAAKSFLGIHSPSKEFVKVGKFVVAGFVQGLNGNSGQVTAAFNSMRDQLSKLMTDSQKSAAALTKKLHSLQSARKKDAKAIAATTAALRQAQTEYNKARSARASLVNFMTDDTRRLKVLASQYDALTPKIAAAKQKLADLVKVRDDYKQTLISQYSNLPSIEQDTKLPDYVKSLQDQILQTKVFTSAINKLHALGLNDDSFKQILDQGLSALPFVSQLLDSGKAGIKQINDLDKQLTTAADGIGHFGAMDLYQAGVNSAQGFVDGLIKQQKAIDAQMAKMATAMAVALKKALGIKSPSRVFAEIGDYSTQGLIQGLENTASAVGKSAEGVGDQAVSALRKAMQNAYLIVQKDMDLQPQIRPVLDLTDIKKGARTITDAFPSIDMSTAYGQAKSARVGFDQNRTDTQAQTDQQAAAALNYTQNNYSPKALTPAEVYRQTKNQLSTVKGALNKK